MDIIFLVVLPLILALATAGVLIFLNNRIFYDTSLKSRSIKISLKRRNVRDINHRRFEMNALMQVHNDEDFETDISELIKYSLTNFE